MYSQSNGSVSVQVLVVPKFFRGIWFMKIKITQVLETLSKASAIDYFEHAVLGLSRATGADFVYVANVDLSRHEASTLALCERGQIIPNFHYSLTDTPCEDVANGAVYICKAKVCKEFPNDHLLEEMGIEGYVGIPLYDRGKVLLGILVALHTQPIRNAEKVTTLFSLFSNLIGMELERIKTEAMHRHTAEQYRDLYDNAPNGYFSIGMDGSIIRCNRRVEEMLGFSKKELIGSSVLKLYADTADGVERAKRILKRRNSGQIIRDQELQMKRADGSIIWISLTLNMIKDSDGKQLESRSMIVDITDRKQSEKEFQRILNISPDLIGTGSLDGHFIKINDAFKQILGYEDDEFLSKPFIEFVHADDVEKTLSALTDAVEGEKDLLIENRYKCKDGSCKWIEWKVLALAEDNMFYAAGRDVTAHKVIEEALRESEESLNMAQEIASIGSWDWNVQNETLSWSRQAYSHFGLKPGEIIPTYEAFVQFIHPGDKKLVENAVEKALKGDAPYSVEARMTKTDGVEWIMHAQGLVYRDDNGSPVRFIGIQQDITEKRQMEEALRRSQKMDAIGQLTGGIAHDFNNILGVIMGNLNLLKDQVAGNKKALRQVATIDRSAQRAADLTRQLLGFSRHQAIDVTMSDINQVILDMNDLIKRSITPEIGVDQDLAEGLWPAVINLGDFQDVLINLILNARDAMPGSGRLVIETRNCRLDPAYCSHHPDATPGEYVHLIVSDTGVGISPEQQDKIYDPFYTTKEVGKGTGLGLSMVFGFVFRSNGHIDVESELGTGTTFHLYLPRAAGQVSASTIVNQQPGALRRGSETILVVDDEKELVELARESLEALGYHVLTATNGMEALERLVEHPDIALLFSDVVMPGEMNGYELAEQAMGHRSNLKILLTSGHTEKVNGHAQQKYDLIRKPYLLEDMVGWVQSLLGESNIVSS